MKRKTKKFLFEMLRFLLMLGFFAGGYNLSKNIILGIFILIICIIGIFLNYRFFYEE